MSDVTEMSSKVTRSNGVCSYLLRFLFLSQWAMMWRRWAVRQCVAVVFVTKLLLLLSQYAMWRIWTARQRAAMVYVTQLLRFLSLSQWAMLWRRWTLGQRVAIVYVPNLKYSFFLLCSLISDDVAEINTKATRSNRVCNLNWRIIFLPSYSFYLNLWCDGNEH